MKLADLLGSVSTIPLSQLPWAPPLLIALNDGVQDHLKASLDHTGSEVIALLVSRGSTAALQLYNADFELATGALTPQAEPAPVVVVPTPAASTVAVPVVAVPQPEPRQWNANKVIAAAGAIFILLISLAMVAAIFTGKQPTPEQTRVMEKAIDVVGDVTKTMANDDARRQPQPQQTQPGPFDPQPFPPGQPPYTCPQDTPPQ